MHVESGPRSIKEDSLFGIAGRHLEHGVVDIEELTYCHGCDFYCFRNSARFLLQSVCGFSERLGHGFSRKLIYGSGSARGEMTESPVSVHDVAIFLRSSLILRQVGQNRRDSTPPLGAQIPLALVTRRHVQRYKAAGR